MLIERLYQGQGIPEGTKPVRVRQVMVTLLERLAKELNREPYLWAAVCTVAVEAGRWKGERLRKRRLKLQSLIQECASFLGEADPTAHFPKGWESFQLYYGYGAAESYYRDRGLSTRGAAEAGCNLAIATHLLTLLQKTAEG